MWIRTNDLLIAVAYFLVPIQIVIILLIHISSSTASTERKQRSEQRQRHRQNVPTASAGRTSPPGLNTTNSSNPMDAASASASSPAATGGGHEGNRRAMLRPQLSSQRSLSSVGPATIEDGVATQQVSLTTEPRFGSHYGHESNTAHKVPAQQHQHQQQQQYQPQFYKPSRLPFHIVVTSLSFALWVVMCGTSHLVTNFILYDRRENHYQCDDENNANTNSNNTLINAIDSNGNVVYYYSIDCENDDKIITILNGLAVGLSIITAFLLCYITRTTSLTFDTLSNTTTASTSATMSTANTGRSATSRLRDATNKGGEAKGTNGAMASSAGVGHTHDVNGGKDNTIRSRGSYPMQNGNKKTKGRKKTNIWVRQRTNNGPLILDDGATPTDSSRSMHNYPTADEQQNNYDGDVDGNGDGDGHVDVIVKLAGPADEGEEKPTTSSQRRSLPSSPNEMDTTKKLVPPTVLDRGTTTATTSSTTMDASGIMSSSSSGLSGVPMTSQTSLQQQQQTTQKEQPEKKEETSDPQYLMTFMDFLCHEIRNPLFVITSTITFLQDYREYDDEDDDDNDGNGQQQQQQQLLFSDEVQGALDCIHQSANVMLRLINDVLDISQLESGNFVLQYHVFDLYHLLQGTASIIQTQLHQKRKGKVTLKYNCQVEADENDDDRKKKMKKLGGGSAVPRIVVGDSVRLLQIAYNLLSNAAKFTEEGLVDYRVSVVPYSLAKQNGWVYRNNKNKETESATAATTTKTTEASSREIVVANKNNNNVTAKTENHHQYVILKMEVEDTGPGIEESRLATIFEPYAQSKLTHYRKHGGTGLGLSILDRLTKIMGGSIHVQSTVGKGSTFTVYIPLKRPTQMDMAMALDDGYSRTTTSSPASSPKATAKTSRQNSSSNSDAPSSPSEQNMLPIAAPETSTLTRTTTASSDKSPSIRSLDVRPSSFRSLPAGSPPSVNRKVTVVSPSYTSQVGADGIGSSRNERTRRLQIPESLSRAIAAIEQDSSTLLEPATFPMGTNPMLQESTTSPSSSFHRIGRHGAMKAAASSSKSMSNVAGPSKVPSNPSLKRVGTDPAMLSRKSMGSKKKRSKNALHEFSLQQQQQRPAPNETMTQAVVPSKKVIASLGISTGTSSSSKAAGGGGATTGSSLSSSSKRKKASSTNAEKGTSDGNNNKTSNSKASTEIKKTRRSKTNAATTSTSTMPATKTSPTRSDGGGLFGGITANTKSHERVDDDRPVLTRLDEAAIAPPQPPPPRSSPPVPVQQQRELEGTTAGAGAGTSTTKRGKKSPPAPKRKSSSTSNPNTNNGTRTVKTPNKSNDTATTTKTATTASSSTTASPGVSSSSSSSTNTSHQMMLRRKSSLEGLRRFQFEYNENVVLVVDDNAMNRKLFGRMLSQFKIQTAYAVHGREAVEYMEKSRNYHPSDSNLPEVGLILMDWSMPVMDGCEAIRAIRTQLHLHHVPIIAVTACALDVRKEELIEAGANEFATKPLLRDDLYLKCRRYLLKEGGDPSP